MGKNGRKAQESDSDTDFLERDESEDEQESEEEVIEVVDSHELNSDPPRPLGVQSSQATPPKHTGKLILI